MHGIPNPDVVRHKVEDKPEPVALHRDAKLVESRQPSQGRRDSGVIHYVVAMGTARRCFPDRGEVEMTDAQARQVRDGLAYASEAQLRSELEPIRRN